MAGALHPENPFGVSSPTIKISSDEDAHVLETSGMCWSHTYHAVDELFLISSADKLVVVSTPSRA